MDQEMSRRVHHALARAYVLLLTETGASPLKAQHGVVLFCAAALATSAWSNDGLSDSAQRGRIELHMELICDQALTVLWDKRNAAFEQRQRQDADVSSKPSSHSS